MKVLLVDDDADRASAVAARDLGADGWVVGSASAGRSLASLSRFVDRWHELPAIGEEDAFVERIAAVCAESEYDVVLTTWDSAVDVLSRRRDELGSVAVPLASREAIAISLDKTRLAEVAATVGIESPRTIEATDDAIAEWEGRAVVKASKHRPTRIRTQFCADAPAMRAAASTIRASGAVPLLQEPLDGELEGIAVVIDRGGALVSVSYQVTEAIWPRPSGVTVRARTLAIDEGPLEETLSLLRELGWFGLAQLQFLRQGPRRALIDLNPRGYGSVALAIAAGARHPAQWARVALDLPVAEQVAVPGKRYQWFTRDLRSEIDRDGKLLGVTSALALAPVAAHSIWARQDPLLAGRYIARRVVARLGRNG
jgi:predicted ATP-grasp superfamily ATP-dependent carboligase